jgi:hypothetical protein
MMDAQTLIAGAKTTLDFFCLCTFGGFGIGAGWALSNWLINDFLYPGSRE